MSSTFTVEAHDAVLVVRRGQRLPLCVGAVTASEVSEGHIEGPPSQPDNDRKRAHDLQQDMRPAPLSRQWWRISDAGKRERLKLRSPGRRVWQRSDATGAPTWRPEWRDGASRPVIIHSGAKADKSEGFGDRVPK
jgi:hypothetical protein